MAIGGVHWQVYRMMFLIRLICGTAVAMALGVVTAEENGDAGELHRALVHHGFSETKAAALVATAKQSEEAESIEPFREFVSDPDPQVAVYTAFAMAEFDEDDAVVIIRELIESGKANTEALLFSLSYFHTKESIDWLVARLATEQSEKERQATMFSLAVVTQRKHSTVDRWKEWTQHRDIFTVPVPPNTEERQRRIRVASAHYKLGALLNVVKTLQSKTDGDLGALGSILGDTASAVEKGHQLQLSEAAENGDISFTECRFAAAAYATALEGNPADSRTRLLRAVALLELGDLMRAVAEIEEVLKREPDSQAVRFVHRFFARRAMRPEEPLLVAALGELAHFDLTGPTDMTGWNDPLISSLFAQAAVDAGVMNVDPA